MPMAEEASQSREKRRKYSLSGAKTIDYQYLKKKRNCFPASHTHTINCCELSMKNKMSFIRQYRRI